MLKLKFILLSLIISSSLMAKEAIYRKIGDLMYIPKKGEFMNETSAYFSTYDTERFYRNLLPGVNTSFSEYTNQVQRFGFKNKLSYGFNKNLSLNLELGYASESISNSKIPSLYFNNMPFNQEVQYDEDNSGMTDPSFGLVYRMARQARSSYTIDLISNIRFSTGDAERSEGYYRGGLGSTSVSITEYANNLANSSAANVQNGNMSSGASSIEIGARMGKKFSPRVDALAFANFTYQLEREITHLNGDLTSGTASDKKETIDAIANIAIGGMVQYRMQPVTFYGGARIKYIPSYNVNTRYLTSQINELEEFDTRLNYGVTLGGKWIIIDRRLLLDFSLDLDVMGAQDSTLRVTSPSNSANTFGVQYEYSTPLNIMPQMKLLFFF